jgi:hypothetical protein
VAVGLETITDPQAFATTRASWHAIAEHVLARARWEATGHIGLRADPEGVATPYYGDECRALLTVAGIEREQYGERAVAPISTLAAAAAWIGVTLGAPRDVYTPTTPLEPDAPLPIDAGASHLLAKWYAFAHDALHRWRAEHRSDEPSLVQLWPEHFDVAVDLGSVDAGTRANYGASPGDAAIAEPYLYVGPWSMNGRDDPFWNQPWGAALPYGALCAAPDPTVVAASFLAHGRARLAPS